MAGAFIIGCYLGTTNACGTYDASGSIIILPWIYYCAIILYFGAAFTKGYAQAIGLPIYPTNTVWVKEVEMDSWHGE